MATMRQSLLKQLASSIAMNDKFTVADVFDEVERRSKSGYFYDNEQTWWNNLSYHGQLRFMKDVQNAYAAEKEEWRKTAILIAELKARELAAKTPCYEREAVDEIMQDEEREAAANLARLQSEQAMERMVAGQAELDAAVDAEIQAGIAEANEDEDGDEEEPNERRSPTIRQRTITRLASEMWFEKRVSCNKDWTWINATFLDMGGDYWEYYHEVGAAEMLAVIASAEMLAVTLQEVL